MDEQSLVIFVEVNVKHIEARERRDGLVDKYYRMMEDGVLFDPVRLSLSHRRKDRFRCVDGNHRTLAAKRAGIEKILAIVPEMHYNMYVKELQSKRPPDDTGTSLVWG